MASIALVNGVAHSWVDIACVILGVPVMGITAIKYEEKQEKTDNYGAGKRPVSRGYGKIEATASLTLLSEEVLAIEKAVPTGNIMDIPPFDIVVAYIPTGLTNVTTDVIKNCEFKNNVRDTKEGDMKIEVAIELICSHIQWNK